MPLEVALGSIFRSVFLLYSHLHTLGFYETDPILVPQVGVGCASYRIKFFLCRAFERLVWFAPTEDQSLLCRRLSSLSRASTLARCFGSFPIDRKGKWSRSFDLSSELFFSFLIARNMLCPPFDVLRRVFFPSSGRDCPLSVSGGP